MKLIDLAPLNWSWIRSDQLFSPKHPAQHQLQTATGRLLEDFILGFRAGARDSSRRGRRASSLAS